MEQKYELIITVNITCMMVLASVYLSVSASLPTTQSIKPVEIWLLFNLAYPFLVIMANIIKQVPSHYFIVQITLTFPPPLAHHLEETKSSSLAER